MAISFLRLMSHLTFLSGSAEPDGYRLLEIGPAAARGFFLGDEAAGAGSLAPGERGDLAQASCLLAEESLANLNRTTGIVMVFLLHGA
jgi:hypothetical protein